MRRRLGDIKNVDRVGPPRVIVSHACVNGDRASTVGPEHARTLPRRGTAPPAKTPDQECALVGRRSFAAWPDKPLRTPLLGL